jgi:urease accessory protein
MRRIEHDAPPGSPHQDALTLPFELRCKSRLRVRLDSGQDAALFLPRGRVLRGGDLLRADDGTVVLVRSAAEDVSTASAHDASALARAAYHLGNRHVALQVGSGFVRYQHDHVLDDMVRALGLTVRAERAPFEPEGGAYAASSHAHSHAHAHSHPDVHSHAREDERERER